MAASFNIRILLGKGAHPKKSVDHYSQGGPGKGDDLDDRGADAAGPASGQGKGMGQDNWWGMSRLPEKRQAEEVGDSISLL